MSQLSEPADDQDVRAFVGPPDQYDTVGANQFMLLVMLGLREWHDVLDIGCGSLRAGKLLLPYLEPGRYCGVEPERWLVDHGITAELGHEFVALRRPEFRYSEDFPLRSFGRSFDYVVAQSIFSHAAPQQIEACLQEVAAVLAPDGRFVATFLLGDRDYAGRRWVYPEIVAYTTRRVERFASDVGLRVRPLQFPHPGGQTWFVFGHDETVGPVLDDDIATLAWRYELANRRYERLTRHPLMRTALRAGRAVQRARRRITG